MFKDLKIKVQENFKNISSENLFYADINRDKIWDVYLSSFPDEATKQENTCNCCKSFLRQFGGIIAIKNDKVVSIWDGIESDDEYNEPVKALAKYIHSLKIRDIFLSDTPKCGTNQNRDRAAGVVWQHFFIKCPAKHVKRADSIDTLKSNVRSTKQVFQRALEEITTDSLEVVLELMSQNSLYRGQEFQRNVDGFYKLKKKFDKIKNIKKKELFVWENCVSQPQTITRIRSSAIGTLIIDLSEGMELDKAVTRFEKVVAPTNYKRPTSLITPKMIKNAKDKLAELDLLESIDRRLATSADIDTENVLFTYKASSLDDVFDEMSKETKVNPRKLTKVEEINIQDFIDKVVPKSKEIELLVENRHLNNFVSVVTEKNKDSKNLFKWKNPFSWSYTGGVTDSIKERVKQAGGNVDGVLRTSLSWYNYDDLDIHCIEPGGNKISYSNTRSATSGNLDVDMNAGGRDSRTPVENIVWTDTRKMKEGIYEVKINNYGSKETNNKGYAVQIEHEGEIFDFEFNKSPASGTFAKKSIKFSWTKADGINFLDAVDSQVVGKEKWGVDTNTFVKVNKLMLSPNYWSDKVGNKHYMFMLENCVADEKLRPFFNEFLDQKLNEHRKVFEVLSAKMEIDTNKNQLSGIGFSETKKDSVYVRVKGSFSRTLKVNF